MNIYFVFNTNFVRVNGLFELAYFNQVIIIVLSSMEKTFITKQLIQI